MFSFFDSHSSIKFGANMALFYMERMPLNMALKEQQFAAKSQVIIEKMNVQIKEYRKQNKLNFYKVAQMGTAFKWALKDAGYDDDYVNNLTQWFVVKVKS
ncbi:MAG: hypothetical protein WCH60_01400 [Burkholderiales bacterium]